MPSHLSVVPLRRRSKMAASLEHAIAEHYVLEESRQAASASIETLGQQSPPSTWGTLGKYTNA